MLKYLIVFVFCYLNSMAQDPDTLLTSILRLENDTEIVNQLYTQGFDLIDKNPQSAYKYAQNCERISQKTKSLKHISKSTNLLGILFYKKRNYKKALIYFEKYLAGTKAVNNNLGEAFAYTNIGNTFSQLKQFGKAEHYYLLAIEYYNALNNKAELANGLINLGVLKHEQKQLDAAYENYLKALETGRTLNNYEINAICLNNLAQVFSDAGNYDKALANNYDALELRELMGLEIDMADSYLSIAEIALKQKNVELALENLNLALVLCNKHDYFEGKIVYHKLASEFYSQKNDFHLAYQNLKLFTQLNDSLLRFQSEEPVYDFEENVPEISDTNYNADTIRNKSLIILLLLITIFISYTYFKNKR